METFDAVIVGGGPAGSTCAKALTQSGFNVAVLDKAVFPRDKICAGWITPHVIAELAIDVEHYRQDRVLQPITAFVTGLGKEQAVNVQYNQIVSYGIRRCEFDDYLLRRCGAQLKLGQPLKGIERDGKSWLLNDSIRTPLLVGAGGHFCPVAQFIGAAVGREEAAITAQEIEFEMSDTQARACNVAPQTPELYFCDDLKGYGWCVRKGNYLNVGLGRDDNRHLGDQLKSFWEWLVAQGKVPENMHARFKGHAYLLRPNSTRPVIDNGAMLIGDAAGLAYPQSGEGIRPAIESGIMAAQTIVAVDGNYSHARLERYETQLLDRFGRRRSPPSSTPPSSLRTTIARSLLKQTWFARHILLDRWFLHSHQPPLSYG